MRLGLVSDMGLLLDRRRLEGRLDHRHVLQRRRALRRLGTLMRHSFLLPLS